MFFLSRGAGAALKQSAGGEGGQGEPGLTGHTNYIELHNMFCIQFLQKQRIIQEYPKMALECDAFGWAGASNLI